VELTESRPQGSNLRSSIKILLAATTVELGLFVALVLIHAALPAPAQIPTLLVEFVGASLGITSTVTLCVGFAYAYRTYPSQRVPLVFIALLTVSVLAAHLYTISSPSLPDCRDSTKNVNGCIMDEVYYVPTAESMLNGTQCGPTVPNCNTEHPFLSKALMAAGITTFGDNAFGWRIFNVLLGTFSLPILFALILRLSGSIKASYLSSSLLALDVMFFSHSGAALIDVPVVFFGLLAFLIYFYEVSFWKLDRFTLAGVSLGLAALSKETAIFLLATLITYHLAVGEGGKKLRVVCAAEILIVTAGIFVLGLQVYDSLFASAAFPTFLDQIHYMLTYGSSLIGPGWTYGNGIQITPLSWMTYYQPVTYYGTSVSVCTNEVNGTCLGAPYSYVGVAYYGVTNVLETWMTYLWVPLAGWAAWRVFKPRPGGLDQFGFADATSRNLTGAAKLAILSLVWFSWNYFPYLALFAAGRVTYPFYFIPALPAVAMGGSYFLTRSWVPRYTPILFIAGAFIFFFIFFPNKAFLPEWLRAMIGR
jgi:4-amino-4-deoxy-L-arabinose transferase-like glycosyltransferase